MPAPMEPRLTVDDLACRRGNRLLFGGLSFDLAPGDALQVVGANGTGKSSLLRIVAGLLRPFAGTVHAAGELALLDDRLPLDEHLPLGKTLDFWNAIDRRTSSPTNDYLALGPLHDVPVRFLSTGQRKRAAYKISNPWPAPIWLLDEPLNGLDSHFAAALVDDLEATRARGGIIVVASHQPIALARLRVVDLADYTR